MVWRCPCKLIWVGLGCLGFPASGPGSVLPGGVGEAWHRYTNSLRFGLGSYRDAFADLRYSGAAGRSSFSLDVRALRTDNGMPPPQPDRQTAGNRLESGYLAGRVEIAPGSRDRLAFSLAAEPKRWQSPNRTGLGAEFALVGRGYGFQGLKGPGSGLPSQEDAGRHEVVEQSAFSGGLRWEHQFAGGLSSLLVVGFGSHDRDLSHQNPSIGTRRFELGDPRFDPSGDSSIEYNPTVRQRSRRLGLEGRLIQHTGRHRLEVALKLGDHRADEEFQFVPGSQLALNSLAAFDLRLVGPGRFLWDDLGETIPTLDEVGNQVYALSPGAKFPTLSIARRGSTRSASFQDTYSGKHVRLRAGARLDSYRESVAGVTGEQVSPWADVEFGLRNGMTAQFSVGRLFAPPPALQGAIVGTPLVPETGDRYAVSLTKPTGVGQRVHLSIDHRNLRNQLVELPLLPGTQTSLLALLNVERTVVRTYELAYELGGGGKGWSAHARLRHRTSKPSGVDSQGNAVGLFSEDDQLNMLDLDVGYGWADGSSLAASLEYGSGTPSTDFLGTGERVSHTRVNLEYVSAPKLFGLPGTLQVEVANLFDARPLRYFSTRTTGTSFQQGRRIMISLSAKF